VFIEREKTGAVLRAKGRKVEGSSEDMREKIGAVYLTPVSYGRVTLRQRSPANMRCGSELSNTSSAVSSPVKHKGARQSSKPDLAPA
jgi:hypothetical protein